MRVRGSFDRKTAQMREHVVRLYVEERWSAPKIARAFDVSSPAVYEALGRAGVAIRALAETNRITATKHGHYGSRTYRSWMSMKQRCYCPSVPSYRYYGARGIAVCARWRHDFAAFLSDMGQRPAGTSIDRIDVNGDYTPTNCRWATAKEQRGNRRTTPCL